MTDRSPELRDALVQTVSSERITDSMDLQYVHGDKEASDLLQSLEKELEAITRFEKRHAALQEDAAELSHEEFELRFQVLSLELQEITDRINGIVRTSHKNERPYTIEFVDLDTIKSLKEFVDAFPLQFVPTKQEIGRILALAMQLHQARVARGDAKEGDPISIVDIGGSSGALGKLVTDLARENGIEVHYTIVDPDTHTVSKAAEFYTDNPSLEFVDAASGEYNLDQYKDNPEMYQLLQERQDFINQSAVNRKDVMAIIELVQREIAKGPLTQEKISYYRKLFKHNFGLEIPGDVHEWDTFKTFFQGRIEDAIANGWGCPALRWYDNGILSHVARLTQNIERIIKKQPTRCDLVINSWMPVGVDFTRDVREVNGGGILYAISNNGATGCPEGETSNSYAYEKSYKPGDNYFYRSGWVSRSTPETFFLVHSNKSPRQSLFTFGEIGFMNAFIIQSRMHLGFEGDMNDIKPEPQSIGLTRLDPYPWEDELTGMNDVVSPYVQFSPQHDHTSPREGLYELREQMVDALERSETQS